MCRVEEYGHAAELCCRTGRDMRCGEPGGDGDECTNKVQQGPTSAKAVQCNEGLTSPSQEDRSKSERNINVDRKSFFSEFVLTVINCAVELQGKSEIINMVLDNAKGFLKVEDLDHTLYEGFALELR